MVGGVPVGSEGFCVNSLSLRSRKIVSKIENTQSMLRSFSSQALHTANYYCLSCLGDYWLQHSLPQHVRLSGLADAIAVANANTCDLSWGPEVNADAIAARAAQLPGRLRGGGIRCRRKLVSAAFLGALDMAASKFLDATNPESGETIPGFFPSLEPLFGGGGFDMQGDRYKRVIDDGAPLGRELVAEWEQLRSRVLAAEGASSFQEGDSRLIAQPPSQLGFDAKEGIPLRHLQHLLTVEVEKAESRKLDSDIAALPVTDMRRRVWNVRGKEVSVWVSAWPSPERHLPSRHFRLHVCTYFGVACKSILGARAGQNIGGTDLRLDPFGLNLGAAQLPDNAYKRAHDSMLNSLLRVLVECGARDVHKENVRLVANALGEHGDAFLKAFPVNRRLGLVPDFGAKWSEKGEGGQAHSHSRLGELKMLNLSNTTYPEVAHREANAAVERRAKSARSHYERKAKELDETFAGVEPGGVGPVQTFMQSHGSLIVCVCGALGEFSKDLSAMVESLADMAARSNWRTMRSKTIEHARGVILWGLRGRLAMAAIRERTELVLSRLDRWVGPNAGPQAKDDFDHEWRAQQRWYFGDGSHPRVGSGCWWYRG